MKKINKKTLIITSIVTVLPILVGMFLWDKLPDRIATHFDMAGTPNGFSSKTFTVYGMPVLLLFFHLLCVLGTFADPKKENISEKMFNIVLWTCPVVSWLLAAICYTYALGIEINIAKYTMIGVGILFMVVGNYLPKCKQSYTMGIKLPWTLEDEDNWNRTHRMAGFLWVLGGILVVVTAFLEWEWAFWVIVILITAVPTIYSYLYYRKNK